MANYRNNGLMSEQDFNQAIEIIKKSNSCVVAFNVPINDNYAHIYDILILESNGSVLNELFKAGFSMSMTKKGLSVTKF